MEKCFETRTSGDMGTLSPNDDQCILFLFLLLEHRGIYTLTNDIVASIHISKVRCCLYFNTAFMELTSSGFCFSFVCLVLEL